MRFEMKKKKKEEFFPENIFYISSNSNKRVNH
jgi:hypothetical protein